MHVTRVEWNLSASNTANTFQSHSPRPKTTLLLHTLGILISPLIALHNPLLCDRAIVGRRVKDTITFCIHFSSRNTPANSSDFPVVTTTFDCASNCFCRWTTRICLRRELNRCGRVSVCLEKEKWQVVVLFRRNNTQYIAAR